MATENSKGSVTYGGLRLSAESLRSLYICLAYGCSSILISLIYKALLRCVPVPPPPAARSALAHGCWRLRG